MTRSPPPSDDSPGEGLTHTNWLVWSSSRRPPSRPAHPLPLAHPVNQQPARTRLLDAGLHLIRAKGFGATTVDDVCRAAGVTKGSFFHHFASKEEFGVAATERFTSMADGLFDAAPFRSENDPRARVLGYLALRRDLLDGDLPAFTCLLGTTVQETYGTSPALRAACRRGILEHATGVARDIEEAKLRYAPDAEWSSESLGKFTQAVLQGAFVLAKAEGGPTVARECVDHLIRYVESLLGSPGVAERTTQNVATKNEGTEQ